MGTSNYSDEFKRDAVHRITVRSNGSIMAVSAAAHSGLHIVLAEEQLAIAAGGK